MPKFVNATGDDLYVYAPEGHPSALLVAAGQAVDVPGSAEDAGDAWLVGDRLWPKANWQPAKNPGKADSAAPDSEKE